MHKKIKGNKKNIEKKNAFYKFTAIGIWLINLFVIIFSVYYFIPTKTVEYNVEPLVIVNENKTARPGDDILIEVDYCRFTDSPALIAAEMISKNQIITLTPTTSSFPEGCNVLTLNRYEVPKQADAEEYYIEFTLEFDISPIKRKEKKKVLTEKFKIITP